LATDVARLCVLPVGAVSTDATELLTSSRMQDVMRTLSGPSSGCIAVIDSPPVLLTSEAPALAELAGQIVLVVRANSTSQQHVLDALELVNARSNTSLIMNQS